MFEMNRCSLYAFAWNRDESRKFSEYAIHPIRFSYELDMHGESFIADEVFPYIRRDILLKLKFSNTPDRLSEKVGDIYSKK
jgi:hypothetical protein